MVWTTQRQISFSLIPGHFSATLWNPPRARKFPPLAEMRMTRFLSFPTALSSVSILLGAAATATFAAEPVREVGALVFDGVPEIPPRIVERMNQYQNVRSASPQDWAPGGGLLISTRFGDTAQLHHVAFPGGDRRQITFYKEPVSSGSYGNEPGWLIFNRDVGGNEMGQIYRFDLGTGKETQLT
jgi:hypothetical protein